MMMKSEWWALLFPPHSRARHIWTSMKRVVSSFRPPAFPWVQSPTLCEFEHPVGGLSVACTVESRLILSVGRVVCSNRLWATFFVYCSVQYCTVLYCAVHYCIVLSCTVFAIRSPWFQWTNWPCDRWFKPANSWMILSAVSAVSNQLVTPSYDLSHTTDYSSRYLTRAIHPLRRRRRSILIQGLFPLIL